MGRKEYGKLINEPPFENCLIGAVREDDLPDEVNSWPGFGRTVEAMEERGYFFGNNCYQMFGFYKNRKPMTEIDLGGTWIDWTKATHQAALDAVKEADNG